MEVFTFLNLMVEKTASDLFFSVGAPVNVKIEGITHLQNAGTGAR
ncbi:hypothetical protein [Candidatus Aalborgicola defluviihabitans]